MGSTRLATELPPGAAGINCRAVPGSRGGKIRTVRGQRPARQHVGSAICESRRQHEKTGESIRGGRKRKMEVLGAEFGKAGAKRKMLQTVLAPPTSEGHRVRR